MAETELKTLEFKVEIQKGSALNLRRKTKMSFMKHNFNVCRMTVSHSADVQFEETYRVGTPAATDESTDESRAACLPSRAGR
jgi:hypothetical protein